MNKVQEGIHKVLGTENYIHSVFSANTPMPFSAMSHIDYTLQEYKSFYNGNEWILDRFYKITPPPVEAFVGGTSDRRVSVVSNWFWKAAPNNDMPKIHLPVPSTISKTMSTIVFGNGFDLEGEPEDVERLKEILEENNYMEKLLRAEEDASWSGHTAFKIILDKEISEYPLFMEYAADQFKVKRKHGVVQYISFYDYFYNKDKEYRLESEYGKGYIKYRLMQQDSTRGTYKEVELSELKETENLKTIAFTMPDGSPLPIIFAFEKANTPVNNAFPDSDIGGSDYTGLVAEFHMFDEIISSWDLAFRQGKTRTWIDQRLLPRTPNGTILEPEYFDTNVKLIGNPTGAVSENDKPVFQVEHPSFDTKLYTDSLIELWEKVLARVGLSPYTVGINTQLASNLSGESVRARERATLRTRQRKVEGWSKMLRKFFNALLMLDDIMNNAVFMDTADYLNAQLTEDPMIYEIGLTFNSYLEDSYENKIETLAKAVGSRLMSIEYALKQLYPDMTDEERAFMLMQINGETAGASEEEVDEGGADVLMPNPGEGREEFVARFMADGDMIQRFTDDLERSSAAMQKWRFENEKVGGLLGGQ
jgi:hypothetical protein